MPSAVDMEGGSFATRPLAVGQTAAPVVWTALVAIAGLLLTGHVTATTLLSLAVVAGLTHGTTDVGAVSRTLRRSGRARWAPFLLGYLGLVAATLAAWTWMSVAMLALFLLLSAVHFGMQDAGRTADRDDWLAVIAHGGTPIVIPAVFHSDEVMRLFATLVGARAGAVQAAIAGPVAVLWALAVAATVHRWVRRGAAGWTALADLALTGVLFAAASPLVAFALYFALLHTPRAFAAQRESGAATVSTAQMVGLTGLACLLGLGIYRFGSGLTVDDNIVRTSFTLLGALTVPHMALEWLEHRFNTQENRHV